MTRANVHLITNQGTFKLQGNSDMYPSSVFPSIFNLVSNTMSENYDWVKQGPDGNTLSTFISEQNLTLGSVGNFSYFYEINFTTRVVKCWENKLSWVNAPENWKERGWNCWIGKNGKFGYTNWVKGKCIFQKSFEEMTSKINTFEYQVNENLLSKSIQL